jgi:hypothetical protein
MPPVAIRQMDGLTKVLRYTSSDEQAWCARAQADRIIRATDSDVPDPDDRHDVRAGYGRFIAAQAAKLPADQVRTVPTQDDPG